MGGYVYVRCTRNINFSFFFRCIFRVAFFDFFNYYRDEVKVFIVLNASVLVGNSLLIARIPSVSWAL